MGTRNRMNVAANIYQGRFKRVLCVCSAGILRSPTAAVVLSQEPYNFNTRACGADAEHALVPIDDVLLDWADEIVCMQDRHERVLRAKFQIESPLIVLDISDDFAYRDPYLVQLIKDRYAERGPAIQEIQSVG